MRSVDDFDKKFPKIPEFQPQNLANYRHKKTLSYAMYSINKNMLSAHCSNIDDNEPAFNTIPKNLDKLISDFVHINEVGLIPELHFDDIFSYTDSNFNLSHLSSGSILQSADLDTKCDDQLVDNDFINAIINSIEIDESSNNEKIIIN